MLLRQSISDKKAFKIVAVISVPDSTVAAPLADVASAVNTDLDIV